MLGGADNPNGELPSYITGADTVLAGRVGDAAGRTGLAGSDAFPDSFENEASLISPLRTVDMGESIIVLPEQGPAFIRLRFPNGALSR